MLKCNEIYLLLTRRTCTANEHIEGNRTFKAFKEYIHIEVQTPDITL